MAVLKHVTETHTNKDNSSKLDLLAGSTFQYLQAMEELSAKGIESELELSKLRLSKPNKTKERRGLVFALDYYLA